MKLIILLMLQLITSGLLGQTTEAKPVKIIPSVSIYDMNGNSNNLSIISKDRITIIDFWFIPCGPCFAEMNMLHDIYARYKDNPKVLFMTFSITDSGFVRPLTENRNTINNDTYAYFNRLAKLDTFKLPVYFIKEGTVKMTSFIKSKQGFSGHGEPWGQNNSDTLLPTHIFGFSACPTVFIFDKYGNTIYNHTGFLKKEQPVLGKAIQTIIDKNL